MAQNSHEQGKHCSCGGDKVPAVPDHLMQFATSKGQGAGRSPQGGKVADPNGLDPRKVGGTSRKLAEEYQYQTSGTRFGSEVRLQVNVNGLPKTIDVDGIVDGFLHESKYIDSTSRFYSTRIGTLGTGLRVHVAGWGDELQRLSLAATQNGYRGAKVFVDDQEAIRLATELFGETEWFQGIEFVAQTLVR